MLQVLSVLAQKICFDKQPNLDVTYHFKKFASNCMFLHTKSYLHRWRAAPMLYFMSSS